MWSISKRLESLWRQKSRATGVKLGDHNTRFFQLPATNRGRRNFVGRISSNGGLITDPTELKAEAVNFFSGLSSTENWSRLNIGGHDFRKLSSLSDGFLERKVYLNEMKLAVRICDCSKAPGPYGFNFIFHKRARNFFSGDFFYLASRFSRKRILPRRINDAYISLISKEKDAVTFSEFRLISLVNSEGLSVLTERAEDGGFFTGIYLLGTWSNSYPSPIC